MKTFIISVILFFVATVGMSGQNIAFGYDADGNMEARYVVTLRTSWGCMVSKKELEFMQLPVDMGSYLFERLNFYKDSTTVNSKCSKCENKTVLQVLENEPAYIKEDCYKVFGKEYSFVIVLANRSDVDFSFSTTIYPCIGISEEFQIDGLPVLISGNILDCKCFVACKMLSNAKYATSNLFELRTIKNFEK